MDVDGFEWDDAKAEENFRKHGVDFVLACRVFDDQLAVEVFDQDSSTQSEARFLITGMAGGATLTVVYTERAANIRLISARRATRQEHDDYYRQNS